jgi:hypothetical protein
MSLTVARDVIDRALNDAAYQALLLARPDEALKGCDLSEAERSVLQNLASSPYTAARRGLTEMRKLIRAALDFSAQAAKAALPSD